ncbi:hypothetical protein C4K34_2262 [Pseudomonas chlororaphis subsp. piscium]|nr:hypothetical protein C4K34_2262 [Pseudomonas chlororaphis subsp. piscium]AZC75060.1 hypothetical protein C4K31_2157 [Pseudomonas chlororaphis subsp. piscium]AZC81327.1 hypothetical protein C4K30_2213 [Pseudomonas chlororaphis subsp. piscium]AZC88521.1 hypothetical protein C4K29_2220 [Pseudomonas chlororaphis subsp. piscium]
MQAGRAAGGFSRDEHGPSDRLTHRGFQGLSGDGDLPLR